MDSGWCHLNVVCTFAVLNTIIIQILHKRNFYPFHFWKHGRSSIVTSIIEKSLFFWKAHVYENFLLTENFWITVDSTLYMYNCTLFGHVLYSMVVEMHYINQGYNIPSGINPFYCTIIMILQRSFIPWLHLIQLHITYRKLDFVI